MLPVGGGAGPGAGGPKEPVLGLLTIIEPGIPMLATGMPIIPCCPIMGTPLVMIGIPMLLAATAVEAIPITGIPMLIAAGPADDKVPNDPMAGEGSAFRDWGSVLGSSYPCNFFFIKCIAIENSFLSIFPSLFISASCHIWPKTAVGNPD